MVLPFKLSGTRTKLRPSCYTAQTSGRWPLGFFSGHGFDDGQFARIIGSVKILTQNNKFYWVRGQTRLHINGCMEAKNEK